MEKLKTLRDIETLCNCNTCGREMVGTEDLRAEAVKWVKEAIKLGDEEFNKGYCDIANKRLSQETLNFMGVKSGCDANDDGIPPKPKVLGILPNFI